MFGNFEAPRLWGNHDEAKRGIERVPFCPAWIEGDIDGRIRAEYRARAGHVAPEVGPEYDHLEHDHLVPDHPAA